MTKSLLLVPALLGVVGLAHAGARADQEVVILHGKVEQASGSVLAARESADDVQGIGCMLQPGAGAEPEATCSAQDSNYDRLQCVTRDPQHIKIIASISHSSGITFVVGKGGNCSYVSVSNGSWYGSSR